MSKRNRVNGNGAHETPAVATETVTPETVTPETVTPETVTPETPAVATETPAVATETVTPETSETPGDTLENESNEARRLTAIATAIRETKAENKARNKAIRETLPKNPTNEERADARAEFREMDAERIPDTLAVTVVREGRGLRFRGEELTGGLVASLSLSFALDVSVSGGAAQRNRLALPEAIKETREASKAYNASVRERSGGKAGTADTRKVVRAQDTDNLARRIPRTIRLDRSRLTATFDPFVFEVTLTCNGLLGTGTLRYAYAARARVASLKLAQ